MELFRMMHFGLSSADAAWYGGLLGDVAWTIEPALVLSAPWLMGLLLEPPLPAAQVGDTIAHNQLHRILYICTLCGSVLMHNLFDDLFFFGALQRSNRKIKSD